jgi:GNAT superfamily N-acetyltransferase
MDPLRRIDLSPVATPDEVAAWVDVYNGASPCRPEGPVLLRHRWESASDWRAWIAWRDGRPVGVAHVEHPHWAPDSRHAEATVAVPPALRGTGIGTSLYRHASTWARERGFDGLEVWVDAAATGATSFWERRGFVEDGRERISLLDLSELPPERPPPPGVQLVALAGRPDLDHGMYLVAQEGIPDVPGPDAYDSGDFDHWRDGDLRVPGLVEEATVVALADGTVVGFASLVRFEAMPDRAEHELTAVARAWRGRGLARALKSRQARLARDAGLRVLEASNEERNAPMLAVNEALGYRPETWWLQLRGPLAGPA